MPGVRRVFEPIAKHNFEQHNHSNTTGTATLRWVKGENLSMRIKIDAA